ncbi:hypothetical protein K492DRAFT_68575 [Lichtheimia hyalospora FSU 10163]|nr:hypothetical protein K492DRAFT_68575 [Lichtheimia hyalospora FSU 10163]
MQHVFHIRCYIRAKNNHSRLRHECSLCSISIRYELVTFTLLLIFILIICMFCTSITSSNSFIHVTTSTTINRYLSRTLLSRCFIDGSPDETQWIVILSSMTLSKTYSPFYCVLTFSFLHMYVLSSPVPLVYTMIVFIVHSFRSRVPHAYFLVWSRQAHYVCCFSLSFFFLLFLSCGVVHVQYHPGDYQSCI